MGDHNNYSIYKKYNINIIAVMVIITSDGETYFAPEGVSLT